ncbi:MAG: sulfatase [Halioglobus sp.]
MASGIKIWIGRALLILVLPLSLLIGVGLWLGYSVLSYEQTDDREHLAAKESYLERVALGNDASRSAPNIVFILFDDLGFGDLGFTGSRAVSTPTLDRLAAEGVVLSNFYSPAAACTPARAGFLTGRYPLRAGLPSVVFPSGSAMNLPHMLEGNNLRLPAEEITLADIVKAAGYRTGMVGKWHMGDQSPSLPNDFGFDSYFGALYSNDMTPFALYRDREIEIAAPADQTKLNGWYAQEAQRFIRQGDERPFFLYFAHNFPHIPLAVPAERAGNSSGGLYGDVVESLDWGVAQIVAALKARGVYDNTLIIVTSDNGPWYQGSPGSDRGRKGDTFEGGMHVPFLAHWPKGLNGGRVVEGISMGIDLVPTVLELLDLPPPEDRQLDGKSVLELWRHGEASPHDYLYYFAGTQLMAVRDARYKYHDERKLIHSNAGMGFGIGLSKGPWLFDTDIDDNESYDTSMSQPAQTQRLGEVLAAKREEMETNQRGWVGK